MVIGELDGRTTERVEALHRLLLAFEPKALLTDNVWGFLWGKMIYGALLFATALTNDSIAAVFSARQHRVVLAALGREVRAVADAQGIRPEAFDGFDPRAFAAEARLEELEQSFADMVTHNSRSAKSHTGVWRDLAIRKRKTEAEAQLGAIVEAGQRLARPTPLTAKLLEMITDIEEGRRTLSGDNLTELAATLSTAPAAGDRGQR